MTHPDDVVTECVRDSKGLLKAWLKNASPEDLLRIDGIQNLVDAYVAWFERAAFEAIFEMLTERGERIARPCPRCGLPRERDRKSVRLRTKRLVVSVDVFRYRCRPCGHSRSPVREWLGIESGQTTGGFDRAVSALATDMSFGAAATQMLEQHGHEVDRTLVERRTYAVGSDAARYLEERADRRIDDYMNRGPGEKGASCIEVQVDSAGVRVGKLMRPPLGKATETTPVRGLPKGHRPSARREVRAIVAKRAGAVVNRVVDLHVSHLKHPETTGDRMFVSALEAGLGNNTHVHCISDMAAWQPRQFEEQFEMQPRMTICADYYHALEYIAAAAPGMVGDGERKPWLAQKARQLMGAERTEILEDLRKHECRGGSCPRTDGGECAVKAAIRYLGHHGEYMDYPTYVSEGLTIGSGAVEGIIRHAVRRRLDVPGDWKEENLKLMTALLTVRHSGWWEDFWQWRDDRDKHRLRERLAGCGPERFRGPPRAKPKADGHEMFDFEELSPMFEGAIG